MVQEPRYSVELGWAVQARCDSQHMNLEAHYALDATIRALENLNDEQARRYIHYFGRDYWNPTVRSILRLRYIATKNKFSDPIIVMRCTWEDAGNTYATTLFYPGRSDLGATINLYSLFWNLRDVNICGDGNPSKRIILIHEGAHAAFEATDRGIDPANDAYVVSWYAQSEYSSCAW